MYELERFLVDHAYISWMARVEAFCRGKPLPPFRRRLLAWSCARVFALHNEGNIFLAISSKFHRAQVVLVVQGFGSGDCGKMSDFAA